MDEGHPSSSSESHARARRRVLSLVIAAAIVLLIAGIALRAKPSSSSASLAAGECGGDLGGPSALVGFDERTGALRWSRPIGEHSGVAQLHGVIAAVGMDGEAIGVDSTTGELRWCRDLGAISPESSPRFQLAFVAGTDVVATLAGNGHVVGLDPTTGATRWDTEVRPSEGSSLVGGSIIYVMGLPTMTTVTAAPAMAPPVESQPPAPSSASPTGPPASMPAAAPPVVLAALDASTGTVIANATPPSVAKASLAGELVTTSTYSPTRQEISVGVRDPATDTERWSKVVPGFTASITNDAVLVIDQTGGTGDATRFSSGPTQVQTVLTAYAASTGDERWHVSLPGTPQQPFEVDGRVLIANGPQVFSIDATTGEIAWSVDHGSPGITDGYSEPGSYWWFASSSDATAITGLITAAEPYRD